MTGRKGNWQLSLILFLVLSLLVSCSKSREDIPRGGDRGEDSRGSQTETDFEGTAVDANQVGSTNGIAGTGNKFTTGGSTGVSELSTEEEDRRKRENRVKPIDYQTGAVGGITISTTFEESRDVLSTPLISGDWYVYDEGLYVIWRENDPRYPHLIWINNKYEGALKTGNAEIGDLKIGRVISEEDFGEKENLGAPFLKKLYNFFHDKEEGYDCMATAKCQIRFFAESNTILWMLPKLVINMSSDRLAIADMRVILEDNSGEQNTQFDLISGQFVKPESDKSLVLGQTYGDLIDMQERTTEFVDPDTNAMYARYGNVYNILTRSNYDRDYKKPERSEILKGFGFASDFENTFSLNNKPIVYTLDEETKMISLSTVAAEGSKPFQMKLGLDKNKGLKGAQFQFMSDFTQLIKSELDPTKGMVGFALNGANYFKDTDRMNTSIRQYDMLTNVGKSFYFGMDRIQGNLSWVETGLLLSPFNSMVANNYFNDLMVGESSPLSKIGSFEFGQEIGLIDLDRATESVTVSFNGIEERMGITEKATLKTVPLNEGKFLKQTVAVVSPSDFPMTLLLKEEQKSKEDQTLVNRVIGMTTSISHDKNLNISCGGYSVAVQFGLKDVIVDSLIQKNITDKLLAEQIEVDQQISKVMADEALSEIDKFSQASAMTEAMERKMRNCIVVKEKYNDGSEMLSNLHFPGLNLILNFDKNDLSTLTTYKN